MSGKKAPLTISRGVLYGYAMGEFGFTFFLFLVAYYLMVFMTDVLEIPMGIAAVIYTAIQWLESITMVTSGLVIDRLHLRWGKFRPWLIIGSVLCAVATVLFYTNFHLNQTATVILFVLFYVVSYTGYNFMWVAYRTMVGQVGDNPRDAVALTTTAAQMGSLGGLLFGYVSTFVIQRVGGGSAYTALAAVCGTVLVISMLVVHRATRGYDDPAAESTAAVRRPPTLRESLGIFSRPMIIYFCAVMFREAVSTILPTLLNYYFRYVVHDETWMASYLTVTTLSTLVGYSFARRLASRYGKKRMFITACLGSCLFVLLIPLTGNSKAAFLTVMGGNAFCSIYSGSMLPAFLADIARYNEQTRGVHARAFTFSTGGTAIRFASIVGGGLASFGLYAVGYEAGRPVTEATAAGITSVMTFGTIGVILISVIFMLLYRLDQDGSDRPLWSEKSSA